ncbi:hypothetical protein Tco_1293906 [Tanacetum coccineum]
MQAARDSGKKSYADLKRSRWSLRLERLKFARGFALTKGLSRDREVKQMKRKPYPISQGSMELQREVLSFTWDREESIQKKFSTTLFTTTAPSSQSAV